MYLHQIATLLESSDPQQRMKGITELRHHPPADAVPLLKQRMFDKEFLIRSFVAMGLGYKQTEDGFAALLDIVARETDSNVIAEAANSLAKYGDRALPHLEEIFEQHPHWLVRQSIFAALEEFTCPAVLLKLCRAGYEGDDLVVKQVALTCLQNLYDTPYRAEALAILLQAANAEDGDVRAQSARILRYFDDPAAKAALEKLRKDLDFRVIGATLEGLV
ncbi:HEAT repeat domain-containing protein [Synechococcus sp. PCC 7336]|uniref:HEAT repeat domain-containing protein n=1 Tax=Synechococcus sp. PCC 7336 TaxID=195250 RepID=UPI00034D599D|nr:HEAT repeat domain-containing protein [Synechococcus sp. PCC 7336]